MQEKDLTPAAMRAIKANMRGSIACEVKICKTESIPFGAVRDHQAKALLAAKHSSLAFKIPDFGAQNPFDFFILDQTLALVCVIFYAPRKYKEACVIDIDDWLEEEQECGRKSMTRERAKLLAQHVFDL